jgi:hypothetical protein
MTCDTPKVPWTENIYGGFLQTLQTIINMHVKKVLIKPVQNMYVFESLISTMGYFALKSKFKQEILDKIDLDKKEASKLTTLPLLDSLKYLILLTVQSTCSQKY